MELKIIGLFAIILAAVFLLSSVKTGKLAGTGEGIKYTGIMCYKVNNRPEVCSHNTYTNLGKNITRDRLGWAVGAPITAIGVGNGTAVAATDVVLNSEINECGLSRGTAGTVSIVQTSTGNFSAQKVFSVTCSAPKVNTTGLYNATSGNFLWAGDTISPEVTNLANGDTLTITWYVWST